MLSRLVITFLPRSKHLLISGLQSPPAVILELKKIKSVTASTVSPSICHEVMGPDAMIFVFWMLSFKPTFHSPLSLSCVGEGNGNPLQYSCLENPRDWRAGWAAVYGVAQSRTWLSDCHLHICLSLKCENCQISFSWAAKSMQMVTVATKLNDACSLEE